MKTKFGKYALLGMVGMGLFTADLAVADEKDQVAARGLVDKARITVESFLADKDMAWLRDHMMDAKGLLIIPELLKGGFILGAPGAAPCFWCGMKKRESGVNLPFTPWAP